MHIFADNKPTNGVAQSTEPEITGNGKSATEEIHEPTTIVDKSLENPILPNFGLIEKEKNGVVEDHSIEPASNVSEVEGQVKVKIGAYILKYLWKNWIEPAN